MQSPPQRKHINMVLVESLMSKDANSLGISQAVKKWVTETALECTYEAANHHTKTGYKGVTVPKKSQYWLEEIYGFLQSSFWLRAGPLLTPDQGKRDFNIKSCKCNTEESGGHQAQRSFTFMLLSSRTVLPSLEKEILPDAQTEFSKMQFSILYHFSYHLTTPRRLWLCFPKKLKILCKAPSSSYRLPSDSSLAFSSLN